MARSKFFQISVGSGLFALSLGVGYMCWDFSQSTEHTEQASKVTVKAETMERAYELSKTISKSIPVQEEQKVIMNDPAINQAWGIKKSDAERAWQVTQGSKKIVVAVIDTGADVKHEDIKNNLWVNPNPGEDGCANDVHGCNFITMTGDLTDNHGHGTHIAGIIGAEAGNKKGVAGISPNVSLMILKYYDPKVPGADNLKNTVKAIRYAIRKKVDIINYSGGGTEFSKEEHDAVEEARKAGILFVAAAGNERSNSDKHKYYPADYGLSNIISVTAIDPSTEVLSSSNYGVETVDIAAPGQNIISTLPNNSYGYMTGTSQATAFVTGAAVLVMSRHPEYKFEDVKKYVLTTGSAEPSLIAKTKTSKILNLYRAVTMLDGDVGASGVIAANAVNVRKFASDPNLAMDNTRKISSFGKSLMENLEKHSLPKKN